MNTVGGFGVSPSVQQRAPLLRLQWRMFSCSSMFVIFLCKNHICITQNCQINKRKIKLFSPVILPKTWSFAIFYGCGSVHMATVSHRSWYVARPNGIVGNYISDKTLTNPQAVICVLAPSIRGKAFFFFLTCLQGSSLNFLHKLILG